MEANVLIIFKTMTKLVYHIKRFDPMYTMIVIVIVSIQLKTIENMLNYKAWSSLKVRK